ncbi:DUF4410 domain-containing protein [Pseudohalioglobus lutimaris]|uniref:DUF4410 domain-containing protein n=1 Tax=Pseudohalioglobus lutimaris TaxID=1737061 RepID=A0A2N5WWW6_9GAMM|nr:DUF4410 domain-containing protein [Pseudohalioglobus lutimaris]PLW66720.1 hypothetical protein C0039_20415 [Pseudohalioglobus lutimaris]
MKYSATKLGTLTLMLLAMTHQTASAGKALDDSTIYSGELSKDQAIHVHLFSTDDADLGKAKFRDTANAMVKSAPHLLATDIVESLRAAGFTNVTLEESEGEPSASAMQVTGRFTRLDPGSQNMRVWIGFGAGESKVCISGEVTGENGEKLAKFADCQNGLGWGASGPQGDKGAEILGDRIAGFLISWESDRTD